MKKLTFFLFFYFSLSLGAWEVTKSASKVQKKEIKKDRSCHKGATKACIKALSKVDQNRIQTKIQTTEQRKFAQEIIRKRGISSLEETSPQVLHGLRNWSCLRAHKQASTRAYCYQYWDKN